MVVWYTGSCTTLQHYSTKVSPLDRPCNMHPLPPCPAISIPCFLHLRVSLRTAQLRALTTPRTLPSSSSPLP